MQCLQDLIHDDFCSTTFGGSLNLLSLLGKLLSKSPSETLEEAQLKNFVVLVQCYHHTVNNQSWPLNIQRNPRAKSPEKELGSSGPFQPSHKCITYADIKTCKETRDLIPTQNKPVT
jgi:hypothetical protein